MKTIKLEKLVVTNFKGIANGTFDFNNNTDIIADTQQGKTSLKDAYLFALGIDIDNFYPVDKNNQYIDGLNTNITMILNVDGLSYELSRSATIKYKVDKETDTKHFDGFKKDVFSFDQVPCSTTEYKNKLVDLLGIDDFNTFKFLTILNYFNEQVNWKERRELIYNLYVDKNAIAELNKQDKYNLLSNELLKGKTTSEISTMINSENKRVFEEKNKNAILLADCQEGLAKFGDFDFDSLEKQLKDIDKKIETETNKLNSYTQEAREKLEKLTYQLIELRNKKVDLISKDSQDRNLLVETITKLDTEVSNLKAQGIKLENDIKNNSSLYREINESEFDTTMTICPHCHQTLPNDQIDTIKTNWINDKEKKLLSLSGSILSLKKQYDYYKNNYTYKLTLLNNCKKDLESWTSPKDIATIDNKITKLEKKIASQDANVPTTTQLDLLNDKKYALLEKLGVKSAYNNLKARVSNLISQQKELVNAEIMVAKKRNQLEQYTLDIINTINDSINSHFNGIKFKLFEQLTATAKKDIKETLIVLNNGVDYSACSTGQKAETNMIIVSTLQNTLGVNLPIWVDDASITNFKQLPTNQMIFLYNEKGRKLDCSKIRDIY